MVGNTGIARGSGRVTAIGTGGGAPQAPAGAAIRPATISWERRRAA
jgi:hypothetical protein